VTCGTLAWVATAFLLAALAVLLGSAPDGALDWQPGLASSQPWRAWSAAFVHWSAWHLVANLIGCAVVAAFGVAARVPLRASVAWLGAWPLGHLALAVQPALASYGGLSGVLHAGVAIAAWQAARHDEGQRRVVGVAVLLGLALKLALESPWSHAVQVVPEWDFPVASLAHLTGALAGLLCAVLVDMFQRDSHP
jgi:rhomboid family GlyGly-CTERM serine protease